MSEKADFWTVRKGAVLLTVRLTPKASRDGLDGAEALSDGRIVLKARVRAVPEKGAANSALIKLLAKSLKLPKSAITLESGSTARLKTLRLEGDPAEVADRLAALVSL
jgi:uncharacterized protein